MSRCLPVLIHRTHHKDTDNLYFLIYTSCVATCLGNHLHNSDAWYLSISAKGLYNARNIVVNIFLLLGGYLCSCTVPTTRVLITYTFLPIPLCFYLSRELCAKQGCMAPFYFYEGMLVTIPLSQRN